MLSNFTKTKRACENDFTERVVQKLTLLTRCVGSFHFWVLMTPDKRTLLRTNNVVLNLIFTAYIYCYRYIARAYAHPLG